HFLDNGNLLVATVRQDDVEVALLLGGLGVSTTAARSGGGRNGHRGRSGHAELLFELLEELAELDHRQVSNAVENLLLGQCCSHGDSFLFFVSLLRWWVIRPVRSRHPQVPRSPPRPRPRGPRRRSRPPRRESRRRRSLPGQLPRPRPESRRPTRRSRLQERPRGLPWSRAGPRGRRRSFAARPSRGWPRCAG